jgi:hypothetical protein
MRDLEMGSLGEARTDPQGELVAQFCETWQRRLNLQLDDRILSLHVNRNRANGFWNEHFKLIATHETSFRQRIPSQDANRTHRSIPSNRDPKRLSLHDHVSCHRRRDAQEAFLPVCGRLPAKGSATRIKTAIVCLDFLTRPALQDSGEERQLTRATLGKRSREGTCRGARNDET